MATVRECCTVGITIILVNSFFSMLATELQNLMSVATSLFDSRHSSTVPLGPIVPDAGGYCLLHSAKPSGQSGSV